MADLGQVFGNATFDASKVDPNEGFDVIPAGEYEAAIVKSDIVPNSKGTGKILKLQLQIVSGQYQNRVIFDQLNIENPNEEAKKISLAQLSSICRAVNVLTPRDTSELHDKTMRISVKVKDDATFGKQNKISAYKPRLAGTPAPAPAMAGSGAPSAPWAKA